MHELFGLVKVFDELVDIDKGITRTRCDTTTTAWSEQIWIFTFFRSHRRHDSTFASNLFFIHLHILKGRIVGHTRNHLEQIFHWAHILYLIQLIDEIVEIKGVFPHLFSHFKGFLLIVFLGSFLNQSQHISHTENTACHTVRVEGFNVGNLFTSTSEFDWFSCDMTNRKGRTTTSVPINLSKDNPSHFQLSIKLTRNIGRFLTNHGINHEENFVWLSQCFHVTKLIHQKLINLQTTCRINQDIVIMISLGLFQTLTNNLNSWNLCSKSENRNVNLLSQCFQLVNSCGTIDVGRNHQRTSILFFFEFVGKFSSEGCFTSPLQTNHHDNSWDFWRFDDFSSV